MGVSLEKVSRIVDRLAELSDHEPIIVDGEGDAPLRIVFLTRGQLARLQELRERELEAEENPPLDMRR